MPPVTSVTRCWTHWYEKNTYEEEYRPPSLDGVWDSGTIDKIPNLLHQFYRIVIANGPSIIAISTC
jgi:hypothetical protein